MGKNVELWDQLDAETSYQYEGFRCYYSLPRKERSVITAYKLFSGNPTADRVNPTFQGWAKDFAWAERARARDGHLDRVHLKGVEEAIQDAARDEHRAAQEIRGRLREMLTLGYQKSVEYLENIEWNDLSARDVVQIIKMHIEATKEFGVPAESGPALDDWEEADDREVDTVLEEVRAEAAERSAAETHPADPEEGT